MTHQDNETALPDAAGRPGEASPPVRPGRRFSTDDRRRLLGIDEETLALVRGAAPILRDNVDRIVKEFYRRVLLVKPLVELATTHSSVERLSETLREYILDFADTTLDAAHVASRERIAAVHDRIDLPVDAYLAQLQAIRQVWTEIVFETAGQHKRSVKESLRLVTALDKLLAFDEGTVCLFFMDTRQRRVEEVLARIEAQHEAQQAVQGELTLLADELAGASEESSASVQEMTATAEQVAGEVSAAASQSQAATATAKEGLIAVHAAEASVESVRAATEQLARSAEELDGSSAKIEQIATSLAETADQINLLALNAAIEAARAGDVGRGFTVVADEVRRLAESTQRRLGEANSAVREMRASVDDVRTAGQGAAGQVASLGETTASVRGRFDEITVAVEAMATSLDAIAAASGQVASAASDTGHGSGEVARLATEVKAVADRLAGE